jgi:uncharacterized protein YqgQ
MSQRIHVQDDLFFITLMVKTLRDGFSLEIDGEIFLEKTVDDIAFIDKALSKLYGFLDQNTHLIERKEYLRSLLQIDKQFGDLLSGVLNRDFSFSDALDDYRTKISATWDEHRRLFSTIQSMLSLSGSDEFGQTDIVSHDELSGLLGEEEKLF